MKAILALVFSFLPTLAAAQSSQLQWKLLEGGYNVAQGARCNSDSDGSWMIDSKSINAHEIKCIVMERNKSRSGWFVALDCRAEGDAITYMGTIEPVNASTLKIDLTEYRGATGAPDIKINIFSCSTTKPKEHANQNRPNSAGVATANVRMLAPKPGSSDRVSIMNAARIALKVNVQFKVSHLMVLETPAKSLAIAEIEDATAQNEVGGILMFEKTDGPWRATFMTGGGGGANSCADAKPIIDQMIVAATRLGAPRSFYPDRFWYFADESQEGASDISCAIAEKF